jgi:hypothetical protein
MLMDSKVNHGFEGDKMNKAYDASTGSISDYLKYAKQKAWEDAGSLKFKVECLECGRKFKTTSMFPSCPKCGGSDIDVR